MKLVLMMTMLLLALDVPAQNREATSCYNPLLINSKPVDYTNFSLASKGLLTVVTGNSETTGIEKIPFRIYLRRDGKNLNRGASDTTRSLLEVDVATVLALAKPGDYLVIEPTRKSDAKARRIIKLKEYFLNLNLLSFLRKDDC